MERRTLKSGSHSARQAPFPYEIVEDPARLSRLQGWDEEVYRDFMRIQNGELSEAAFREKYAEQKAILILDMTGFTESALARGSLFSFMRIMDVQQVCAPVFEKYGALRVRAFADDFTATFDEPEAALACAFEIHTRVKAFNESSVAESFRAETCIGLGYGEVFRIGPDRAMGNEMNQTSKLGEDTADGFETLITPGFHEAVRHRADVHFQQRVEPELPFVFYAVTPKAE